MADVARPKVVPLADHARTNAQMDVLTLLRDLLTSFEDRQARGEALPTSAFIILADEGIEGYDVEYLRAKITAEKECYILLQALQKCLDRGRM